MSKLREIRKLSDRIFFFLLCVVLLILFLLIKGLEFKGPGHGTGLGPGHGQSSILQPNDSQKEAAQQNRNSPEQNPTAIPVQTSSEPPNVARLFLGRQGISEDQETWHVADQFADFIKQLQARGVKAVYYTLLDNSIERYEEKWAEELKKANMRSYIEADGDSL